MDDLNRKRGSLKTKLTNFSKFIKSFVDRIACDNLIPSEIDLTQIEDRLSHVSNLISEFDDLQNLIESKVDEKDLDQAYEERENFTLHFYSQTAIAKNILSQFKQTDSPSNTSTLGNNNSSNQLPNLAGIKLKPIELPKFQGSYHDWLEFADLFESLVHNNVSLDNIHKFHYLRSSLEGGAAQVIRSIEFTSNNYSIAWQLIRERYDNKRLLIFNHVKALFNIEQIHKESSHKLRTLIDTFSKHLHSLQQLNQPTEYWDVLLIHIITLKLDSITLREWENNKSNEKKNVPTLDDLKTFLKSRADFLETLESNQNDKRQANNSSYTKHSSYNNTRGFYTSDQASSSSNSCPVCKQNHTIYNCNSFMNLGPKEKFEKAKNLKICTNCLKAGHYYKNCRLNATCKKCGAKHHTLLHLNSTKRPENSSTVTSLALENQSDNHTINCSFSHFSTTNSVILSTALVNVTSQNGKVIEARALLDCGSQSSFISTELCENLNLQKNKVNWSVSGINNVTSKLEFKCQLNIGSRINSFVSNINCFVIPEITGLIPAAEIDTRFLEIPQNLKLADPTFFKTQKIDILIGNDLFWELLLLGKFSLGKNKPFMQKTVFGWIIAGCYLNQGLSNTTHCNLSVDNNIQVQETLKRFWELEEVSNKPIFSNEETACEQHFKDTTIRDESGRFIVSLPLKKPAESLGESLTLAKKRFFHLEKKLNCNSNYRALYVNFIEEYISLGHMKRVGTIEQIINTSNNISYFLPHHGVFKENSLTTKLRVVFDGSAPTSNGISVNNILMAGPPLQDDLISILLRFRIHPYVVCADIEKMYRQVLIRKEHQPLQRILWRTHQNEPLAVYDLTTVTYGMKSSSYLAIKCLHTLGVEYENKNKKIAEIIKSDFYVDDLLTGFNSIQEAQRACREITTVLRAGGFSLRKFYSNKPQIFESSERSLDIDKIIQFGENENVKSLGLSWLPTSDHLLYEIKPFNNNVKITKRVILSDISQIFDPLGLLGPCIIIAKIMLQRLWLEKLSWDDQLPTNLRNTYLHFRNQLTILNNIRISRHIKCNDPHKVELHGFSDSSEKAYGACLFIKSIDKNNKSYCNLLCAKSKVAPLKPVTLPRLELCGALLLSRLFQKVKESLKIQINECFLWTDSTIVLCWIKGSAKELKTFVSNRVAEIQEITTCAQWRHVTSKDNPADLLSRGVLPEEITNLSLWWHGPSWLVEPTQNWPKSNISLPKNIPEIRNNATSLHTNVKNNTSLFNFERFSNLLRLKRCAGYVLRFVNNCKVKKEKRKLGSLSTLEIDQGFRYALKQTQNESFAIEINTLNQNKCVQRSSKTKNLNPFLDNEGLLRVGGRLVNSQFSYDKKHPIIISPKHPVTILIFRYYHSNLLHAGPQLLLSNIRDLYWPLAGRNLARRIVHECVKCFRLKPKILTPIMGNLPSERLLPGPPFLTSGVDYGGPFLIRNKKGRGCKLIKSYICLFVCFSTKAVHIELVTDLSKETFLLALKRFIARRGKPNKIFSDNGKNFVSASSDLKQLEKFLLSYNHDISDFLSKDNITWHFSPPYSPHFGGLWEAGIKLIKHHIKRVLGLANLTYEEFYTLLTQIESIINSRPLFPLSSDPNDLSALTPAHFLIGRKLTTTPDPELTKTSSNRLTRYQLTQKLSQHIWERWSKEYVSELQHRTKWTSGNGEITKDCLVLIKDDNLPPMSWKLGRAQEVIRGKDGVPRVFKIRTANGIITRSFSKVCPLPISESAYCIN